MADLSQKDIAFAATNLPALSDMKVALGGREFPVLYLEYDAQMAFVALLGPLMESVAGRIVGIDAGLTMASLVQYCGKQLPELAQFVLGQSDDSVTIEWVKKHGSPFTLAAIVFQQIQRNQMMEQIVDFFKQVLPLLKLTKQASTKK